MRKEMTLTVLGHIAGNIRRLRERKKLTQEELAEMSETDTRFIQRIERGVVNFSIDILVSIAEALGVSPTTLFRPSKISVPKPGRPSKKRKKKK